MDVYTFLPPENDVALSRRGAQAATREAVSPRALAARSRRGSYAPVADAVPFVADPLIASVPAPSRLSFAALGELPGAQAFPLLFVLLAALALSVTPLIQNRWGGYRLEAVEFAEDGAIAEAMREFVDPAAEVSDAQDAELPASIQPVSYSSYQVRKGDTVSTILRRSGLRNLGTLLSVNGIDNARRIKYGTKLSVPSMDGIVHRVVRGDNLAKIAKRYGVPVTALLDANDLQTETLSAGQRLFVPGGTLGAMEIRRALGELFAYPIRGRLTSRYGTRNDPFTGRRSFHTGIDLAAPLGTLVRATMDGKVATTGYSTLYGNFIIVSHDGGYQSLYGHLSYVGVSRGQSVSQSTIIGRVGNTGYSTGPHLHLSIYKNGKMVDPLSVLK